MVVYDWRTTELHVLVNRDCVYDPCIYILVYTFSVSKQCGSLPEHHSNSVSTCASEALHPCRIFDMLSAAGLSFVLWLLCAFEMNFIILLAQSLTQSSLCRLVFEVSTRDYLVSSYIITILAQQWLQYLVICGGDQTPNTVFENQLKIYCIRYSEWVLCNNNLEIQKCEGIIFVHSNKFDVKRALSLNFWENLCWKTYKLCIIKSYQRGQARFDINFNVAIECIYVVTLKLRSLCIIWSKCEQNAAKIKASALWR